MKAAATPFPRARGLPRITDSVYVRVVAGLGVLLGVGIATSAVLFSRPGARLVRRGLVPAQTPIELPKLDQVRKRPMTFYENALTRSGVFVTRQPLADTDDAPAAVLLDSGVAASLAELQLQGVISGARGLQAIIVNIRTEQSFDCQGGELLAGFTVREVLSDRVILERDGKRYELRL